MSASAGCHAFGCPGGFDGTTQVNQNDKFRGKSVDDPNRVVRCPCSGTGPTPAFVGRPTLCESVSFRSAVNLVEAQCSRIDRDETLDYTSRSLYRDVSGPPVLLDCTSEEAALTQNEFLWDMRMDTAAQVAAMGALFVEDAAPGIRSVATFDALRKVGSPLLG
ncbi:MAG: hypothetical protein BJ554DRAFT_7934 [Olpidium bornovanus]|uniref:Uncharacterized protein n=1 Tax=Olpidium bornovanus TaxID=278681 RepID=A0A8H7ZVJ8_9FUNG|nr:MAG: hypothetical protein BJ554DRAFT_7934 [Olpidium bornovanus]